MPRTNVHTSKPHKLHTMADNNTDLGGATLDLSGGTYLISAPLVIPGGNGNLHIVDGTLRASPTFPATRWLVEIGGGQFINLSGILFDAAHVAAGGVRVSNVFGTTLSAVFGGMAVVMITKQLDHVWDLGALCNGREI